jgi:hypothetical protein
VSFRPPLPAFVAAGVVLLAAGYLWGRKAAPASPDRFDPGRLVRNPHGAAPSSDEKREAAARQSARIAFWDGLDRRVQTETVDAAWKRETEATIARVIPAYLGSSVSVEVTCASTICRAKLRHPEWPRIPEDRFVKFTLNRESLGTMEIQLDTRAERTTTLYFVRLAP